MKNYVNGKKTKPALIFISSSATPVLSDNNRKSLNSYICFSFIYFIMNETWLSLLNLGAAVWSHMLNVVAWIGGQWYFSHAVENKIANNGLNATTTSTATITGKTHSSQAPSTKGIVTSSRVFVDKTSYVDKQLRTLIKEKYKSGTSTTKRESSLLPRLSTGSSNSDLIAAVKGFSCLQDEVMKAIQDAKISSSVLADSLGSGAKKRGASIASTLNFDSRNSRCNKLLSPSDCASKLQSERSRSHSPKPPVIKKGLCRFNINLADRNTESSNRGSALDITTDTDDEFDEALLSDTTVSDLECDKSNLWTPRLPHEFGHAPVTKYDAQSDKASQKNLKTKSNCKNLENPKLCPLGGSLKDRSSSEDSIISPHEPFIKKSMFLPKFDITTLKGEIVSLREEISARKGKLAASSVPHFEVPSEKFFVSSIQEISNLREEISSLKNDFFTLMKENAKNKLNKIQTFKKISSNYNASTKQHLKRHFKSSSIDSIEDVCKSEDEPVVKRLNSFNGLPVKGTMLRYLNKNRKDKDWASLKKHPSSTDHDITDSQSSQQQKCCVTSTETSVISKKVAEVPCEFSSEAARNFQPRASTMIPVRSISRNFSASTLHQAVNIRLHDLCMENKNEFTHAFIDEWEEDSDTEDDISWDEKAYKDISIEESVMYGLRLPSSHVRCFAR